MKTTKLSGTLAALLFFYGCSGENTFVGEGRYGLTFKQEHAFPSGESKFEAFGGQNIHIVDSFLLVQHQYENPEYYWDIYNLNTMQYLKSILRRGRGPNEVLFAHYDGLHEKINGENWMFFLDVNTDRFLKINLDRSIRSGNDSIVLISRINYGECPYFMTNDEMLLSFPYNRDDGYKRVVKTEHTNKKTVTTKKIFGKITPDDYDKYLYFNTPYYNRTKNKVCMAFGYVDHIQIIDLDGNDDLILSTARSDSWMTVRQKEFSALSLFYVNPRITNDHIFVLYHNKKITSMQDSPKNCEIHVFDWEGNAIAKLSFNDHLASFAIDEKNKVLYGINHMEQIYTYDISPYL